MPSFAVRNFGCRANLAESFGWADALCERGLRHEEDWSRSDVVLVNSCTLTGRADRDVRKFIRSIARENPATRIVVTGCYAERAPDEVAGMPNVVAVLPNRAKDRLPARVAELAERPALGLMTAGVRPEAAPDKGTDAEASFRARAHLKVQDGCDDRCAFCVIPGVRGRSRSVGPDEVEAAVRSLVGRGFREIVLAGIHLSSYGEDLDPPSTLLDLIRGLAGVRGGARLRLSSLDARRTGGPLIAHITGDVGICQHFHLSLQHISERILRLMGRAGAGESAEGMLAEFRRCSTEAALGADILVGFPGETESDFDDLKAFLDEAPLTYFHVFSYSPRPGTPAAARAQLPAGVVTERARALRRISAGKDFRFRRKFLGRELEAVVISRTGAGAEVLTGNGIRIAVPACPGPERELVRVAVGRVLPRRTEGEVVG